VVDELLPIMSEPGATYFFTEDGDIEGERIVGVVVYGNHVTARPVTDAKFKDAWLELPDPEGGGSLGFVEKKGLESLPAHEVFEEAKFFIVRRDEPALLLQPGAADKKYQLSGHGFSLLKGEIVQAYGVSPSGSAPDGARWLLLGFGTSTEYTGSGGVGMRYAWARAGDLIPAEEYAPDNSRLSAEWTPSGMRAIDAVEPVTGSLKGHISRQGFWIDPAPLIPEWVRVDDMSDLYSATGDYEADFITTDIFLHAHHLIFDHMLQKLERTYFSATLEKSMAAALGELEKLNPSLASDGAQASYEAARDMLTVAGALLSGGGEAALSERGKAEIARIIKADGAETSLLTGAKEDYSQYRPRGHYTLTPAFERYFRAMTFLGNSGFQLFDEKGPMLQNVRTAALLTLVLDAAGETWESFEAPINFLIGNPDDGGLKTYRDIVRKHIGPLEGAKNAESLKNLLDGKKLGLLAEELRANVPAPRIRDRTGRGGPEFRISGKRFTFDAFILNQLTSPRVGTDANPRNLPQGADVMAVLGSSAADLLVKENEDFEHYPENMKNLKNEANGFFAAKDTVYTLWLDALRENFRDSGSKQFFYTRGAWQWKKLMTASASWAELKHDTILYAKMSGAEMGDGGYGAGKFAPPSPRGYIEPDPQVFDAMAVMLGRLSGFFEKFPLENEEEDGESDFERLTIEVSTPNEYGEKLAKFKEICIMARDIAAKQVAGEFLTVEDYENIKAIARSFTVGLLMPGGIEVDSEGADQLKMALVADVATDFLGNAALEVATGTPRKIFVLVNDRSGGVRLARGYVYSYYEFARDLGDGRLTDGEWKKIVYDGSRQDELQKMHPSWYGELETK
jgi:hypothetical protein